MGIMVFVLETDRTAIVMIDRRFDAENAPEVETDLKKIAEKSPERVLFDFSKSEYIASAGMRVLLSITRQVLKKGGKVALCALSPNVRKVFDLAGFTQIFPIYPSREEALNTLKK